VGSATARRLTERGVAAVVLDPAAEKGGALAAELGDRVTAVVGDSNDDDAMTEAIAAAQSRGTFSIAVSATGVVIPSTRLVARDGSPMPKETLLAEAIIRNPYLNGEVIRLDGATRLSAEMILRAAR
jgi:NAD(P)-dependent dehydrogenase (short-subunit alcohol dehydrogenase family)